jgi:hypothetical protein
MGYFLRRRFSRESAGFFFSSFARENDSSLHAIERARASRQTQQRIACERIGARAIAAATSLVFVVKRQRHGFSIATPIVWIVSRERAHRKESCVLNVMRPSFVAADRSCRLY